jgi:hypothetical protein
MQFTENVLANWQEGYCFIITKPNPIQPEQSRREFKKLQGELLEHQPYSPDLAPSDFQLFGLLRKHLSSKRFTDDEEEEMELWKWPRQQSGVSTHWDKCINVGGE